MTKLRPAKWSLGPLFALLLLGTMTQALAYKPLAECEPRWAPWRIPAKWTVNIKCSADVPFDACRAALVASFTTWSNVACSYMRWDYVGASELGVDSWGKKDDHNLLVWREDSWPKDQDGAIAITTPQWYGSKPCYITDADIIFNGVDFKWAVNGNPGAMDIQNIATHEIGHALGLGDLYEDADKEKTMYGVADKGETKARDLAQDDIDGACALYPGELPANLVGAPCDAACVETDGFKFFCGKDADVSLCTRKCGIDDDCPAGYLCDTIDEGGRSCWPKANGDIGATCRSERDCLENLICRAPKGRTDAICTVDCSTGCRDGFYCGATNYEDQACLLIEPAKIGEDCTKSQCVTGAFCASYKDKTVCVKPCEFSNECASGEECINVSTTKGCWAQDPNPVAKIILLVTEPASPAPVGKAFVITAGADAPHKALLRFVIKTPAGASEVLHDFSQVKSVSYTPSKVGTYEIILTAKDSESTADSDDRQTLSVAVQELPDVDGDQDTTGSGEKGGGGCSSTAAGCGPAALLLLFALLALARRRHERA